jgi:site-specific DNA-methyltransferase (adenine-specific)
MENFDRKEEYALYMNITTHKIINGDCRNMRGIRDNSIQLIVTSPPYWQIKDYGVNNQIGFDDNYETYINNLNIVWRECYRVLDKGCRLCVNVGDQFARSVYYGRYKVIPIHSEIIRFCETAGFDFMGQIIWQKATTMNTTGGGAVMGSYPYPRNGIVKLDFEYILLFKKQGESAKPTPAQKEKSALTKEEWNTYFSGHWHFAGAKQDRHLAMFPDELPRRLIKMFSFAGETVLDPFAGSGTTAKVSRELERHSVSYEINPAFIPVIEDKVGPNSLYAVIETEKVSASFTAADAAKAIKNLPYRFIDVHKLDRQGDIKPSQYGAQAEELFTVKRVISPELIELNNNTLVRLIGIKQDVTKAESAVLFLLKKFKGRRVFLKREAVDYGDAYLPAYVYLDNKTFINAHLLKYGYALVDESVPFSLLNKFIKFRNEI